MWVATYCSIKLPNVLNLIELFYTLNADNYKNDKENFVEIGNSIFQNVRNVAAGKPGSLSFISDYKN